MTIHRAIKRIAAVLLLQAAMAPTLAQAAEKPVYFPLKKASIDDTIAFRACLDDSGSGSVYHATGDKLAKYKSCIKVKGYDFEVSSRPDQPLAVKTPWDWWVNQANLYCNRAERLPGLGIGIGNDYSHYQNCLKDRGVTPSLTTVSQEYIQDVNKYCWGDDPKVEEALSWSLIVMSAVSSLPRGGFRSLPQMAEWLEFGIDTAETAFDIQENLNQNGGTLKLIDLPPRALSNYGSYKQCLAERSVPGLIFKPTHTYDQNHLGGWALQVSRYCYGQVVGLTSNTDWKNATLRACLVEREYPEKGFNPPGINNEVKGLAYELFDTANTVCMLKFPPEKQTVSYRACIDNIGATFTPEGRAMLKIKAGYGCDREFPSEQRGANASAYRSCVVRNVNDDQPLTATQEAALTPLVIAHCGKAVVGGRANSHNEYKACLRERGTTFVIDDAWRNEVKSHCNGAVIGGRGNSHNEYKACLSQRGVDFVIDDGYRDDVKRHCNGAVIGGRGNSHNEYKACLSQRGVEFVADDGYRNDVLNHCKGAVAVSRAASHNEYKACLSQRGVAFVADGAWNQEVLNYCNGAVIGGGGRSYNEYKRCIEERNVGLDTSRGGDWCQNKVKPYCEAQWYPFGGKDKCYKERWCPYPL